MTDHIIRKSDRVEKLLSTYPETRDSDKLLWLAYMAMYCQLKSVANCEGYQGVKRILMHKDTPPFESITRARRKIQERGLYVGKLREKRLDEADKVRDLMRHT